MAARVTVWDAPLRLFHWALAILVVFSYTTGKLGGDWMVWHIRSGYCILTLLVFRLAWGMAGSSSARFAGFVRGPRAALAYARALASPPSSPDVMALSSAVLARRRASSGRPTSRAA